MSLFFFHVHDNEDHPDREGSEFISIEDARSHAIVTAGEMIREHGHDWPKEPWSMTVVDQHGLVVCRLCFTVH